MRTRTVECGKKNREQQHLFGTLIHYKGTEDKRHIAINLHFKNIPFFIRLINSHSTWNQLFQLRWTRLAFLFEKAKRGGAHTNKDGERETQKIVAINKWRCIIKWCLLIPLTFAQQTQEINTYAKWWCCWWMWFSIGGSECLYGKIVAFRHIIFSITMSFVVSVARNVSSVFSLRSMIELAQFAFWKRNSQAIDDSKILFYRFPRHKSST